MKKIVFVMVLFWTNANSIYCQVSGGNLTKEKIVEIFDSNVNFKGIQFENKEVGQCERVILINGLIKKNIDFEKDIEFVLYEERKTCFMSESYVFDMGVISYIEVVRLKVKRKKAIIEFKLIEKNGHLKKSLRTGKATIKL